MATQTLTDLSRYIYGTTRLGDDSIPFADRVAIARAAIQAGGWIHTSHQYGDALKVLRAAFDEDRSAVPNATFKIGWSSVEEVAGQVDLHLEALGIPSMAVGQLCPGGALADDIRNGGPSIEGLARLKGQGLVGRYVMEVWPWTSDVVLDAIQNGHAKGLIDGFIFYLNPLQRFVTNEVWDLLLAEDISIVAMRTVSGGDVHAIAGNENAPAYLRGRAAQVAPIFDRSGIASWTEFAARYSLGFSQVRATVGATSRAEGLAEFLRATRDAQPLPGDIVDEILELQRAWSDEHDREAAPWSM